jgi:hypothetical protein
MIYSKVAYLRLFLVKDPLFIVMFIKLHRLLFFFFHLNHTHVGH